jgi:hypothetical protein
VPHGLLRYFDTELAGGLGRAAWRKMEHV